MSSMRFNMLDVFNDKHDDLIDLQSNRDISVLLFINFKVIFNVPKRLIFRLNSLPDLSVPLSYVQ